MKYFIRIISIVLILFSSQSLGGQDIVAVSPGAKFGYAFGKNGGFIFGLEVSIVDINRSVEGNYYGAVISFETMKNEQRLHVGLETNLAVFKNYWSLLGLEVGPTYIFRKTNNVLGINITPYYGAFVIPYYRLLIVPDENLQHEVGSFLKLHIPVGEKFSLVH